MPIEVNMSSKQLEIQQNKQTDMDGLISTHES